MDVISYFTDAESAVVCCDGLSISTGSYLIASGSGDSYVRIYTTNDDGDGGLLFNICSLLLCSTSIFSFYKCFRVLFFGNNHCIV